MRPSTVSRWLLAGMILIGLAGWTVTGLYLYARLAYLGIGLILFAGIWTILSIRGIRLIRTSRSLRASMGDIFEEEFEIENRAWPACAWLEVVNQSPLPMAAGSRVFTRIGSHQSRFYSARTLLVRRGAFVLGPTQFATGDPFGLFSLRKRVPAGETLIVLPMAFPITTFPPPPGLLPGGKATRQRTMDMTPHAVSVRDYIPGDPMKRVHWASTARRGRFMVKEFEQDPQADIWIFLDSERSVHSALPEEELPYQPDGWWLRRPQVALPKNTFEYAVSSAASLAGFFLADRRAVGLASVGTKLTVISAERGQRQLSKIMETLAFLQPEGNMSLAGLIDLQAKLLPPGSGVLLITPSVRPELLLAVEDLKRRNLRPVAILIDAGSFGGKPGSEKIATGLLNNNIPVCRILQGEDLGTGLALPAVYFQPPHLSKPHFGY